jgi:hypothetical protein
MPTTTSTEQSESTTTPLKLKTPRASLQLTHGLGGYIRRMRLRAHTGKTKSKDRRKAFYDRACVQVLDSLSGSGATDEGLD